MRETWIGIPETGTVRSRKATVKLPTFWSRTTVTVRSTLELRPERSETVRRSVYWSFIRTVGSSVPRPAAVTFVVPRASSVKTGLCADASSSRQSERVAEEAVPVTATGAPTLAPSAGAVRAASGGSPVGSTLCCTVSVVEPVTPSLLARIVVVPSAIVEATPSAPMIATLSFELVQVSPVSGKAVPSARTPVALKSTGDPTSTIGASA